MKSDMGNFPFWHSHFLGPLVSCELHPCINLPFVNKDHFSSPNQISLVHVFLWPCILVLLIWLIGGHLVGPEKAQLPFCHQLRGGTALIGHVTCSTNHTFAAAARHWWATVAWFSLTVAKLLPSTIFGRAVHLCFQAFLPPGSHLLCSLG